jgi:hypothetical protein
MSRSWRPSPLVPIIRLQHRLGDSEVLRVGDEDQALLREGPHLFLLLGGQLRPSCEVTHVTLCKK